MLLFKFLFYANYFCKRQPRTRKFYKTLIVAILVLAQTKNHGKLTRLQVDVPQKPQKKRIIIFRLKKMSKNYKKYMS